MTQQDPAFTSHFAQVLARRERELSALLHAGETIVDDTDAGSHDVTDFKDMAAEQTAATIDDMKTEHAAHELEQVLAARRRLQDHTYGLCIDCGEPIDRRRLEALPATPYCIACQAVHEYADSAARR
ncbi:MAG TPA: TraR/DksA family transcriptional regulator [Ramlibacter sp.]|nr:TraR/DksA family transcriptional regulator [Ramlibacter sp.]